MIATQKSKGIWEAEEINLTLKNLSLPGAGRRTRVASPGKLGGRNLLRCAGRLRETRLSASCEEPARVFSFRGARTCLPDARPQLAGCCAVPWGTAPR